MYLSKLPKVRPSAIFTSQLYKQDTSATLIYFLPVFRVNDGPLDLNLN